MPEDLAARVGALVAEARARAVSDEHADRLAQVQARLGGPLRLAVAGRVKAGKSTLLNALVGEELAPTDAGECTRVLTWYRYGDAPRVRLVPLRGRPVDVPYQRRDGALDVDLGGRGPDEVDHLEVRWPTGRLRDLTILDTPGIASISTDLSARTHEALSAEHGRIPVADAVLYLLRHAHVSDLGFLEAFQDDSVAGGTPVNTVGVLSRADEVGVCRLDAMDVAARIARRYAAEPVVRRLCPVIVPVDGLLARTAATLRESEYRSLSSVAAAGPDEVGQLLLSADRFASRASPVPLAPPERWHLLQRFGLFGIRLSVHLIASGRAGSATVLARELTGRSGLADLQDLLVRQFTSRSRVLRTWSAVTALSTVLHSGGCRDAAALLAQVEQITASAHELEELRLLERLRTDTLGLSEEKTAALDRLLGGSGADTPSRLGVPDGAPGELRAAALTALAAWQRLAQHPLSSRAAQLAARSAVRTLEGTLMVLDEHRDEHRDER